MKSETNAKIYDIYRELDKCEEKLTKNYKSWKQQKEARDGSGCNDETYTIVCDALWNQLYAVREALKLLDVAQGNLPINR